jgi:hypothetical protein
MASPTATCSTNFRCRPVRRGGQARDVVVLGILVMHLLAARPAASWSVASAG